MRENTKISVKGYDYLKNIVGFHYMKLHGISETDYMLDISRLFFKPYINPTHKTAGIIFAFSCDTNYEPMANGMENISQILRIVVKNVSSGYEEKFSFRLSELEKVVKVECKDGNYEIYITEFDSEHPSIPELSPLEIVKNEFETIFEKLEALIIK